MERTTPLPGCAALSAVGLALALTAMPALATEAATDTGSWPIQRYPFLPEAVETSEPGLCRLLVAEARRQFLDTEPLLDLGRIQGGERLDQIEWIVWQKEALPFDARSSDELFHAAVDLDGDGSLEVVVHRADTWSWRGATHSGFVFDSEEDYRSALGESGDVDGLLARASQYYGGGGPNNSAWWWNNLFEYQGKYFYLDQAHPNRRQTDTDVTAYRLQAGGNGTKACSIRVLPTHEEIRGFREGPGLGSYLEILSRMGTGGPDCGTLKSGAGHDQRVRSAILRAEVRPWATSGKGSGHSNSASYYVYDTRMAQFIQDWGFSDPWSQREYRTYLEHRQPALHAVQRHLEAAFGMRPEDAAAYGRQLSDDLTAAFFLMPSSYSEHRSNELYDQIGALLSGATDIAPDPQLLPFAVDNPRLLERFLAEGVDPETSNWFSKTALMYAAHLNRPDAVKILLESGADPNAVTALRETWDCAPPRRLRRSALTYAAENASWPLLTPNGGALRAPTPVSDRTREPGSGVAMLNVVPCRKSTG